MYINLFKSKQYIFYFLFFLFYYDLNANNEIYKNLDENCKSLNENCNKLNENCKSLNENCNKLNENCKSLNENCNKLNETCKIINRKSLVEYLKKFAPIAVYEMEHFGIPASIKLSQSILESNHGNSILSKESNNHFGIKCGNIWGGDMIEHDDDEKGECFRKYESPWHSFRDHSIFLKKPRYAKLFFLCINNYKAWANGLKEAGYATAKDYAERIIYNIEEYQLWRFDNINSKDLDIINFKK